MTFPDTLDIQIGNEIYSIPVEDLVSTAQSPYGTKTVDCDLFIVPLTEDEVAIRLGDPFFVSFAPIFDIENDQLGLVKSKRAPDGTKITTSPLNESELEISKDDGLMAMVEGQIHSFLAGDMSTVMPAGLQFDQ